MPQFYSHGKLLITGEYLVLDGAKALAVPTKYGQDLSVKKNISKNLHWKSFDHKGEVWFETELDPNLITCQKDQKSVEIEQKLIHILKEAKRLNPQFLHGDQGCLVETKLEFNRSWGLGTSSTLMNNIASWAEIDAFKLLQGSMGGSGYDIACAQNDLPIIYSLEQGLPKINEVKFNPPFKEDLFFIFLNQKQNSREGIARYKSIPHISKQLFSKIDLITQEMLLCKELNHFAEVMLEHEKIISSIIKLEPIQKILFKDYFGQIKSLGAWGGDFILATGNKSTPDYFVQKGFKTVIPYREMVL
jgi:mevalonate kinase